MAGELLDLVYPSQLPPTVCVLTHIPCPHLQASAMAGKLLDLVWELTTPADAPPELLASNALLDVLEGYAQHSLLQNYIARSGWVGAS